MLEDLSHHTTTSSSPVLHASSSALTCSSLDFGESLDSAEPQLAVVFLCADAEASSWVSGYATQQPLHWPTALLPRDFPDAAVLTVTVTPTLAELRSSSRRAVRAADDLLDALLDVNVSSLVLVGTGFGGHLLKEVCLEIQRRTSDPSLPPADRGHCRRVLASISGVAFYSTPHVALPRLALPEYEFVLPDVSVVCSRFRALAKNGGWQTLGVGASVQGPPRHSVPLAAAFKDMTHVVAAPADQAGVSRPNSRSHPSYVALRDFLLALQTGLPAGGDNTKSAALMHRQTSLKRQTSLQRVLSGLLGRPSA